MKIYKDQNGAWRIGAVTNPGACGFTVIGSKVKIFAQSNDKIYYYGEITEVQFNNEQGNFTNCTGEAHFRAKAKDIDFFLDATQLLEVRVAEVETNKVDKIAGKSLSTNDYTDEEKAIVLGWQGYWVGYIEDPENSCSEPSPKSTVLAYQATELARTGNMYYHKFGNSRIFNSFRGAIVNRVSKKVDWYLDKNDFTKKADGAASTPDWTTQNICIVVPNIYRRIIIQNEAGKIEKCFDIEPFDGAELWHEESAHSVSFATMDRTAEELCSVISSDVRYRGGNNDASKDGTDATQISKPATVISRTGFENYADAVGWETGNIADRTLWDELYKLYFANSNCQLAYTATLTADGCPQGGTGVGSTQFTEWDTWNGYYPICNVGAGTMAIGCNVGVHSLTINAQTVQIPVFFGLEHLYGEIFDWVSGVNLEKSASVENGGTGLNKAFICPDFAKRSDAITADYQYVGNVPRADGWIKQLMPAWNLPLVNTGASDTVFQSDHFWSGDFPAADSFVRGLLFGAAADYGSSAGVRTAYAWNAPSAANASIGARLRAKIVK